MIDDSQLRWRLSHFTILIFWLSSRKLSPLSRPKLWSATLAPSIPSSTTSLDLIPVKFKSQRTSEICCKDRNSPFITKSNWPSRRMKVFSDRIDTLSELLLRLVPPFLPTRV